MKPRTRMIVGGLLVLVGLLIIDISVQIVFPGLSNLLGTDAMFGKGNLVRDQNGIYHFTNPRQLIGWVSVVVGVGAVICAAGIWISGIRIRFRAKSSRGA